MTITITGEPLTTHTMNPALADVAEAIAEFTPGAGTLAWLAPQRSVLPNGLDR